MSEPAARVVLLGASNLARSLPVILELLPQVFTDRPLDVLLAHGHGRSYGQRSSLLARALPGLLDCGLWRALDERPPAPTYALITDVGNDLAYGAEVEQIAGWLDETLARLARHRADTVLTGMPVSTIARLTPWQLELFQWLFFPFSEKQSWNAVQHKVSALERRLRQLASTHAVSFVEQDPSWYGLDPIHIHRRAQPAAFSAFFSRWRSPAPPPTMREGGRGRRWRRRLGGLLMVPERRWLFGVEQGRVQPCAEEDWGRLGVY